MAHDPKKVSIEPGVWGADALHWLAQARGHATMAELYEQHQAGAALFYARCDGQTVGAWLLRIDQTVSGAEGVIVAAAAKLGKVDMVSMCLSDIEARFSGVKSIRFHTSSPALARKLARRGYAPREIVSAKKLG